MRAILVTLGLALATPAWAQSPVTAWCGGGVTGGGNGTRITPDGTITRLSRNTAGSPEVATPLGQDEAAFRRWTAALAAVGFSRLASQPPGNMTCTLSQGTTTLRWPGGQPPEAVAGVFAELRGWRP
ncbi:hypothetical protein [Falsiroseomonas sp.]|uniref:hypothetical protein n=1 Tax=Falsiroseomonas sp. TaxID=2870721 RepID=UPI003F6E8E6A